MGSLQRARRPLASQDSGCIKRQARREVTREQAPTLVDWSIVSANGVDVQEDPGAGKGVNSLRSTTFHQSGGPELDLKSFSQALTRRRQAGPGKVHARIGTSPERLLASAVQVGDLDRPRHRPTEESPATRSRLRGGPGSAKSPYLPEVRMQPFRPERCGVVVHLGSDLSAPGTSHIERGRHRAVTPAARCCLLGIYWVVRIRYPARSNGNSQGAVVRWCGPRRTRRRATYGVARPGILGQPHFQQTDDDDVNPKPARSSDSDSEGAARPQWRTIDNCHVFASHAVIITL
ncbi:hypothetical protein G7Z17_g781 [Cylindrodendrum hubeiense]|uniref:Uncharacterized protein n=1 Tax=Cylindrodendrum hubeiense TaxID=595255 RepID=A0A9P5HH13_9HYPO|nr:hypothetical protein G7Z17_g781 [Cylindrodendrum hubeiense]